MPLAPPVVADEPATRTMMDANAYRNLKALEELFRNESLTQRHLAKKLEVALGLTNFIIRRLVKKGYIKLTTMQNHRIRYLITPKGVQEQTRLTYEYLEFSLHLYRRVLLILRERLSILAQSGHTQVVIFGTGEIAEIAYLTIKESGLNLLGVADDAAAGTMFLGMPVLRLEQIVGLPFDCGIISSMDNGLKEIQRLRMLSIMPEQFIAIRHHGANIQAYAHKDVVRTT